MNLRDWLAGAALISIAVSVPAHAGQIRSPIAVVGATIATGGGTTGHIIDQSGLSVPFVSGATDFDTYIASGPTHAVVSPTNGWASHSGSTGYLEFDLGDAFSISTFALWTQNNPGALNSFSLSSALDIGFTSGVSNLGSFNAAEGIGAQTFAVSAIGEFVRLQINSSHGATNVNIGEVAFDTTVLPEPAPLAVLCIGLSGLGLARRSRGLAV
jgi:hypothetical protein